MVYLIRYFPEEEQSILLKTIKIIKTELKDNKSDNWGILKYQIMNLESKRKLPLLSEINIISNRSTTGLIVQFFLSSVFVLILILGISIDPFTDLTFLAFLLIISLFVQLFCSPIFNEATF